MSAHAPSPPSASPSSDDRLIRLQRWLAPLAATYGLAPASLRPASNDASFRRYFRIDCPGGAQPSLVVMDAPPPQEDCRPFVHAAQVFREAGVSVPQVFEADLAQGFLLLEDFGSQSFLDLLDEGSVDALYGDAVRALVTMQRASRPGVFAPYDRALLLRELMLFPDWYLARHRGLEPSGPEREALLADFERLLANNLAQPAVYVHRDYHSRNLMKLPGARNPGILDFQDAVYGPITYDLVSLLRDAYVTWDEERVLDHAVRYWQQARGAGLPVPADVGDFYRDFDWMSIQRQLKVLGIFARLYYRDGKDRYLADLPRVLAYVKKAVGRYAALAGLRRWLDGVDDAELVRPR
ncbi:MAG TPA: phosphotransferase [Burkholderiaceae bacterium]|nr:phosphotransferase [Burkholderiaceae bacterium]